jgi:hypothetical protein
MKKIIPVLALIVLLLVLAGCGGTSICGAWQAQAMDGLVFEFQKDGGFSVRRPDDPGNVLEGSYTLTGETGIEIVLEGGEETFSGTYAVASGELVLTLSGEQQHFSRYGG